MKTSQSSQTQQGFTLIECMAAAVIFAIVFSGLYLVSSRVVFALDASRQSARATDIAIANIEYLRTRRFAQLASYINNTNSPDSSCISENMIVSRTNPSNILAYLELDPLDPQNIFLTGLDKEPPTRTISLEFYPDGGEVNAANATVSSNTMIKATVTIAYVNVNGKRMTNSMTTLITEGGLSANPSDDPPETIDLLNMLTGYQ